MDKPITILGVPMDLGQQRRGVDMGPSAIRYAELVKKLEALEFDVIDLGDVSVEAGGHEINLLPQLRNLEAIAMTSEKVAKQVSGIVADGRMPLVLGGDHSVAMGTLAGLAKNNPDLGLIWYDAHGDLNTDKTSPSGNIHGMPLAVSLGLGHELLTNIAGFAPKIKPENVVLIGARDLDQGERELIRQLKIKTFTMHEIDRLGMTMVMEETIEYLKEKTNGVHLSLDLDALDPHDAPGVGTPVIGGLSYRESHLAMEMLAEARIVKSLEFVEVNPILDERNRTAEVAVALIESVLGDHLL